MMQKIKIYKENLKQKIVKANEELSKVNYKFKTN
jgi:5-(carboxyamino)imidazole ribonucleotide mutase